MRKAEKAPDRPGQIIIGLGSGRCGTTSLAILLNAQPRTVCFHEINPSAMSWEGSQDTVTSLFRDFDAILAGGDRALTIDRVSPDRTAPVARMKALDRVTAIGDIAHYYLPYVETILANAPGVRFPCLRRDRTETVKSFATKMRLAPRSRLLRLQARLKGTHLPHSRNHWAGPNDTRWQQHSRFDHCFPSYEGRETASLEEHLERWYDDYYARAEKLAARFPDQVRMFDMSCLNAQKGRIDLLEFCLPGQDIDPDIQAHANANPV